MCEVLKDTFQHHFPAVEKAIRQADFIAIDTEFSGLHLNEQQKPSLFDHGESSYKKLRKCVSQITVLQLGMSIFAKDTKEDNSYICKSYNFYLFPGSFGPVDTRFVCQTSSLQFLCQYDFDFNKFIYNGISFVNEDQEKQIREHLSSKAMFTGFVRDIDEKKIQKICSDVAEWFVHGDNGDSIVISSEDMDGLRPYLVGSELKGRFPLIWTTKLDDSVRVDKISIEERQRLEADAEETEREQKETLLDNMLGFTRVFRILKECKKPLLGHNMMMDLMLLYDKFHKPLPARYDEFKKELHMLFPRIYDTKHLAFTLRKRLEDTGVLNVTALGEMYTQLASNVGRDIVIHPPEVQHDEQSKSYENCLKPHEAGFDAYMCGYAFLRMAHIITFQDVKSSEVIPCPFRRYLQSLDTQRNKINLIRASTKYLCLDGPDPPSFRPELLYVRSRRFQKLNIIQLAKWFSPYGSVDIQQAGKSSALVATGNFYCAKRILGSFHRHPTVYVTQYKMWKHSPVARSLLWTGALLSGGLCVWVLCTREKTN